MSVAESFKTFPPLPVDLPVVAVDSYDYWITLGGYSKADLPDVPTQLQLDTSLQNAMHLHWNAESVYLPTGNNPGEAHTFNITGFSVDADIDSTYRGVGYTYNYDYINVETLTGSPFEPTAPSGTPDPVAPKERVCLSNRVMNIWYEPDALGEEETVAGVEGNIKIVVMTYGGEFIGYGVESYNPYLGAPPFPVPNNGLCLLWATFANSYCSLAALSYVSTLDTQYGATRSGPFTLIAAPVHKDLAYYGTFPLYQGASPFASIPVVKYAYASVDLLTFPECYWDYEFDLSETPSYNFLAWATTEQYEAGAPLPKIVANISTSLAHAYIDMYTYS